MPDLQRLHAVPIPPIYPEPEYRVTGRRAPWYADMKAVFQVPWMGVVTMAFSHYPNFFETLWDGLRPMAQTTSFVEGCLTLRTTVESEVRSLQPESIGRRLHAIGYAPRELDQIRATIDVFSHGNYPYLLVATAARRLLEGYEIGTGSIAADTSARHAPEANVPFVLMENHHADPSTRAIYDDIKNTLGLPFVNTDYRALARWPSYFSLAWRDLKSVVGTSAHVAICAKAHSLADQLMGSILPNQGNLTVDALASAVKRDNNGSEIHDVANLFQWLLPGLVTNIAFFRAQLFD